jgi:hypothetical protein
LKELIAAQAQPASAAAQDPRLSDNPDQPKKMAQLVVPEGAPGQSVVPVAGRPVGRTRKNAFVVAATAQALVAKPERPVTTAASVAERGVPVHPIVQSVKRPVARPRKTGDASAVAATSGRMAAYEAGSQKPKAKRQPIADQQPVEWWVSGWNSRSKNT